MFNESLLVSSKQTLFRHLAAWLSVIIYYTIYSTIEGSIFVKTVWIFLLVVNYSFTYYTLVLFIWPQIISEKRLLYSLLLILLIISFCSFFYFQLTVITPWLGGMHSMINWPLNEFINNALRLFAYIFFTSIGTYYNWVGLKKIEEDLKVERNILEMEFLFLKNQFHSHLTFNFLNFCYNKVRIFSPLMADSVEELSNMLRYSLITSSDSTVPLEKEIEYIENYISFQKFLTPNLNVQVNYKGDLANIYILPKVFSAFVEYFLKNNFGGVPMKLSTIFIESTQDEIIFQIETTKSEQNIFTVNEELRSIEQILGCFYGNEYSLQILDDNDLISCKLKASKRA